MKNDTISDHAIVLSRVNYGETDRVLNVLTSQNGKLSAIAKGVRAGKSKLAGGIELFAENELILLKSKSELYIVTSSQMKDYFGDIAKNLDASAYVYDCLKVINKLIPEGSGEEYYQPLLDLMRALSEDRIPLGQIKIWFNLRVLQNLGLLPNFNNSCSGEKLSEQANFEYDFDRHCFFNRPDGQYNAKHIKILRHLSKTPKPAEIKTKETAIIDTTEHLVSLILKQQLS